MTKPLPICAIIAVRNEKPYLKVLLPHLARQGIDVIIADNESSDGSEEIFKEFKGNPIIDVVTIPYKGYFSLSQQLEEKDIIADAISHEWILHHDADEIMEGRNGETLRSIIECADKKGYNGLNFDEFVFLPEYKLSYLEENYYERMTRYYFFEPHKNRLNRAFRHSGKIENITSAGHRLTGEAVKLDPNNHTLRHYIILSEAHARQKYLNRDHDPIDLKKGWHRNRLDFTQDNLAIPAGSSFLRHLKKSGMPEELDRSMPVKLHFWSW